MAIVASRQGGLVACPGGPYHTEDGPRGDSRADPGCKWPSSWQLLRSPSIPTTATRSKGRSSRSKATTSIRRPRQQRQLWCVAISAKRYALFLRDRNGEPELLRKGVNNGDGEDGWSQHGLGHLLNPTDPESDDRSVDRARVAGNRAPIAGAESPAATLREAVAVGQIDREQSRSTQAPRDVQRRETVRDSRSNRSTSSSAAT